ncbi:1498_t:CDS:2 [Scutellospora calospora]|uniref:1498_t:CDS:1 n=1 Tax=Scutellospora calospora TaxID=85575 RepID=A0ACA9KJ89_9GLOM|nr:1498_t:CDS:2 [Scutellospora calospora]
MQIFLNSLKRKNTTFGQYTLESSKLQQNLENKSSNIKKRIKELAINYIALVTKINSSENNQLQRDFKKEQRRGSKYYQYSEIRYYIQDCLFKKINITR